MPAEPSGELRGASSLLGPAFVVRPHGILERLRVGCPVALVRTPSGEDVWVVTRERDVRAGLKDPRLVTAAVPTRPQPGAPVQLSILNYAPDDHARLRRLAASSFTPARVRAHRPIIERIALDLANELAAEPQADLLADFAYPFAGRMVCELFGVTRSHHDCLYASIVTLVTIPRRSRRERDEALDTIKAILESEVGRRIDQGCDDGDILSTVVHAGQSSLERVTREELLSLCGMLLLAGVDTTAQMLCVAMVGILTHPPLWDRLRKDPGAAPDMLEELLRWDSPAPFATKRIALADIELGGTVIPAGGKVMLSIMAANRDPEGRPDPDIVDPDRIEGNHHVAFGLGPHYCLGAPLARLALEVALTTLLRRCPDLALAVPVAKLPWRGTHVSRVLVALPVLTRDH
jgi:cytochrome P450